MSLIKKKILIAHPYWGRGGAEIATMHLISAIKDHYEIHIISRGGWNLAELNHASNTSIALSDIKIVQLPFKRLLSHTTGGAIWHGFFLRYCHYIAPNYDIRITASRIMGWGVPAIHFLSDVVWNEQLAKIYEEEAPAKSLIRKLLAFLGKLVEGNYGKKLHEKDIFIANSQWTAFISSPYTTTKPVVIYPPVSTIFKNIPWDQRKSQFICLGRISPEKRIEDAISIIESIRNMGHNIGLTIYGQFDKSEYSMKINKLISCKSWIDAPGTLYGDEKSQVLPLHKYGINTCQREAFGISTAELMKAGIIPFVPAQGAQQEIVNLPELIFKNTNDAVLKIVAIITNEDKQKSILQHLNKQSHKFSKDQFSEQILSLLQHTK